VGTLTTRDADFEDIDEADAAVVDGVAVLVPRGFAMISKQKHRLLSAAGGTRAHELGRAHQFTSDEARNASLKRGGHAPVRSRKNRLTGRYEYFVQEKGKNGKPSGKWVSRQRISQLRKGGKL
jgi:hypothetical protein